MQLNIPTQQPTIHMCAMQVKEPKDTPIETAVVSGPYPLKV